jgi:hypothetical protein
MNNKAQMPGFLVLFIVICFFVLSLFTFSLLSPVVKEFVDVGVASSDEHDQPVTSFLIKLFPFLIVILLFGMLVWAIATGGGGG